MVHSLLYHIHIPPGDFPQGNLEFDQFCPISRFSNPYCSWWSQKKHVIDGKNDYSSPYSSWSLLFIFPWNPNDFPCDFSGFYPTSSPIDHPIWMTATWLHSTWGVWSNPGNYCNQTMEHAPMSSMMFLPKHHLYHTLPPFMDIIIIKIHWYPFIS